MIKNKKQNTERSDFSPQIYCLWNVESINGFFANCLTECTPNESLLLTSISVKVLFSKMRNIIYLRIAIFSVHKNTCHTKSYFLNATQHFVIINKTLFSLFFFICILQMDFMNRFYEGWRDLMDNKSDPRTNEWFLMSSPFPTIAISLTYAYCVKVIFIQYS